MNKKELELLIKEIDRKLFEYYDNDLVFYENSGEFQKIWDIFNCYNFYDEDEEILLHDYDKNYLKEVCKEFNVNFGK